MVKIVRYTADEVIAIRDARESNDNPSAAARCRRALKKGSIEVARWYSHKDNGDFFIMITICGIEFRSVNNYSVCPDAKKVADTIRAYLLNG